MITSIDLEQVKRSGKLGCTGTRLPTSSSVPENLGWSSQLQWITPSKYGISGNLNFKFYSWKLINHSLSNCDRLLL